MPRIGHVGQHIARRVAEVRRRRGMTQARLGELAGLEPTAISKIEAAGSGDRVKRGVSVEDLLALAHALNVSPLDLMLPADDMETVQVAPEAGYEAHWVRGWFAGDGPLPHDADPHAYMSETPPTKQRQQAVFRHPVMVTLSVLRAFATDAILGDRDEAVEPRLMAETLRERGDRLKAYLELLAVEVEQRQGDTK